MDYAGTNYPALTDGESLYALKEYSEALRTALMTPGTMAANVNLNNFTATGLYYQSSQAAATKALNYPVDNASGLVVNIERGNITHQLSWPYTTNRLYTRVRVNASWTVWRELNSTQVP